MTSFQRARSDRQREIRRQAILEAAADMLAELPVAQISLNALSRRVGLAKSNVLRYFESREAVLLELLDAKSGEWLDHLDEDLSAAVDPEAGPVTRGDQVAAAIAGSLAAHPVLCDLVSAQAAVLEHNVSPQAAATYKRATIAHVARFADLVRTHVPELSESDATRLAGVTIMLTGTIWTYSQPPSGVIAAYEADPSLAALRVEFTSALRDALQVLISGLLARSA